MSSLSTFWGNRSFERPEVKVRQFQVLKLTYVMVLLLGINVYSPRFPPTGRFQLIEQLDELDHRLLVELQKDARRPFGELSSGVGSSAATVIKRVKALEEKGVIQGYKRSSRKAPEFIRGDELRYV